MTPRLPTFQVLTGSREVTIAMEPDEWIEPERALDLLATMLRPTMLRHLNAPISSRMIETVRWDVQCKLLDLVHKGVIWESWGAFGIGHDVTVRIRPRQRGAA